MKIKEMKKKLVEVGYDLTLFTMDEYTLYSRYISLIEHKNKLVKHFKGRLYLIVDIAIDSESNDEMVVYRALYDDCKFYVRPVDMFLEEVDKEKYPKVKQKNRFEFIKLGKEE